MGIVPSIEIEDKFPKSIKQIFCIHNWEIESEGCYEYQKGIREILLLKCRISVCSRCNLKKIKIINDTE
ncbi:MAG: hypothetical protein AUJ85_06260 [Elusimicrobia bacterium CG1_02_37_114]|nr:MAG: hypothetical protein AUJ85_06260 [Elusimicrobia bacterium CG1_02_37_114]PIV53270.1 MAG: hypothetical protein COS17_04775 [Elusimicrobia bacterium CG02_land_8_20_14_3_00_37_13]PIZ13593.1 MAG: hypothetical protein COY53_03995 [Elusimicrobia bacterium CG_4_10_14_0_8_um_filter_37_32]